MIMKAEAERSTPDYWTMYYQLRRHIEAGQSRDWRELERLRALAQAARTAVTTNWARLGIRNA